MAGAFVFLLLGVFAVFSTVLVLFGAQAYRTITGLSASHNDRRILHAYVVNAVRADDGFRAVSAGTIDGVDALTIDYDYGDGERYQKRIYCWDGSLRELFASEGYEFNPDEGERICDCLAFRAQVRDGLAVIEMTDSEGRDCEAQIALRCEPA